VVDIKRVLGLDIGDSRIGVAISDPLGILATPLTIINRTDDATAIEDIAGIIGENEVGLIIAGMPLNMDGTEGQQAEKTKAFVQALSGRIKVPIEYRDERLSTVSAKEMLGKARKTGRDTLYDAAAAAIILQSYLNESNPETIPPDVAEQS
jgi:putative Holliday junction resolvase